MRVKLIALSVIAALAFAAALISTSKARPQPARQQAGQPEAPDESRGLSLRERVKLSKLRNEKKLTIRMSYGNIMYAGFRDIDTAAAVYTTVVAKPVAAVSRLNEREQIVTSYRFRTVEILSEPGPQKWPFTFSGALPPELGGFERGDFLVTIPGGTKDVDGVEVNSKYDGFELFSLGQEYLLFLDFDASKTVGGLDMGPLSALEIGPSGALSTLDRSTSHPIKRAIDSHFGNSFEALKTYLRSRSRR